MGSSKYATRGSEHENKKVATVSKSGKITAKSKGSCYIYIFAHNGASKRIKITVRGTVTVRFLDGAMKEIRI